MTATIPSSVLCPVVIGREPLLDTLERLIEQTAAGSGTTVLISGEAGVGKSRLVAEARALAARAGHGTLVGHCFETDRSLPHAPIADLLRSLQATRDPEILATALGHCLPELVKIAPGLAALTPGLVPTPALEPAQEQRRLFDAIGQAMTRLAACGPHLIVIEDVHWADDTSLELLYALARQAASQPILLALTFRSDETSPELRHLLAMLDRGRLATDLPLSRLEVGEVEQMLQAMFAQPQPVNPEFVETLYTLSGGNPFFVEEVVSSLVSGGQIVYGMGGWLRLPLDELRIPRSVQDAVQRRSATLSSAAHALLVAAAVAGPRFDFALLQALAGVDEYSTLGLIKELLASQFLVEEPADQFAFRHALTRQAIYSELMARERRAGHRRVARAIESLPDSGSDGRIADLAYHYAEAEEWEQALAYAARAGERAEALHAPRATIEQFSRAIDAAGRLGQEPPYGFHLARGRARDTAGEFDGALADDVEGIRLAREAGDRRAEWQGLVALGALWAGRDYATAGRYYQEAVAAAETMGDRLLQARSLNRLGNWLANVGRYAESITLHQQALAIFRDLGDRFGEAETHDLLAMSIGLHGDMLSAVDHYDRAIEHFRALGEARLLSSSLTGRLLYSASTLTDVSYARRATPDEVRCDYTEALELAERTSWSAGVSFAEWSAGMADIVFGDLGAALRHAEEGRRIAAEIGHAQWLTAGLWAVGQVHFWMLAAAPAVEALETALAVSRPIGSVWWNLNVRAHLAQAYLLNGDVFQAAETLSAIQAPEQVAGSAPERRAGLAWAEVALARGEPDRALAIVEQVMSSTPGAERRPLPWPSRVRGSALAALGRTEEATAALEEGLAGARAGHARSHEWRILAELAQVHLDARRNDLAAGCIAEARDKLAAIATTIDGDTQRSGFLTAAEALLPRPRPLSRLQADKAAWGGLTAREREVAFAVAEGKMNREIADLLHVSEWTIETHVSNILCKLDFSSRVQIATWVAERRVLTAAGK